VQSGPEPRSPRAVVAAAARACAWERHGCCPWLGVCEGIGGGVRSVLSRAPVRVVESESRRKGV
jgi:hypothetical protein